MAIFIIHSSAIKIGDAKENIWDRMLAYIANAGHQIYFALPDSDPQSAAEFFKKMGTTLPDNIKVEKIFEKDLDKYNSSTIPTAFVYDLIYEKLESKIRKAQHIYFSIGRQHIFNMNKFASSNPAEAKQMVAETKTSSPREKEDLPTPRKSFFNLW